MSALKHTIRHQQAQLQNLESILQRTPRLPLTASTSSPPSSPPPELSPSDLPPTTLNGKIKRRSSFDVLHSLAGPDSNLPLPRRDPGSLSQDGIREGVPMDFGAGPSSQTYKRQSSPTRTLSRTCHLRLRLPLHVTDSSLDLRISGIPVSSVGSYISLDLPAVLVFIINSVPCHLQATRVLLQTTVPLVLCAQLRRLMPWTHHPTPVPSNHHLQASTLTAECHLRLAVQPRYSRICKLG